ncbi:hypothetical protein BsIDN1_52360 [Bacillus safensis]|uniref:Uncharacterized protein n=1 Tax=Bacillus safensis TaxID=561879 RepID=A0A5S9MF09_BACIA|nr:hypothetical protein BsIDN1_52360 [Bacillus safensis]
MKIYKKKIPQAQLIEEEDTSVLKTHEDAILIFMGAGDIQKYLRAYEKKSLYKCLKKCRFTRHFFFF